MQKTAFGYGRQQLELEYNADRFELLSPPRSACPLTDAEIGAMLDRPLGSEPLEELTSDGGSVLFVVPDATRRAGAGQVVNLLIRRLIANGTPPHQMAAIFATGIHRPVTEKEKAEILTPFIAQRLKTLEHDPRDLMRNIIVGETSGGIRVGLDRALFEYDHVVIVGGVTFHYFAGFTGGRKLICPGLAMSTTIAETHRLAFDCETLSRREGVGPGLLDGNAVNEAFEEVMAMLNIRWGVSSIVDAGGDIAELYCGDPVASHRAACEAYRAAHSIQIAERRPLVIAGGGGSPLDVNLIQAHKSLETASKACLPGGTIYFVAECGEGIGRGDMLEWFEAGSSRELAERLCTNYKVNGQTAWSILKKSEEFDIRIVTELSDEVLEKLRIKRTGLDEIEKAALADGPGYIIPCGSGLNIICD